MGMLIALILPSLLFIKVNSKHLPETASTGHYAGSCAFIWILIPQTADVVKSAVGASQSADNSATRKEPVAPEPPPEETEKKDILEEQKLEQKDEKGKQEGEDKPVENKDEKKQGLDAKDDSLRKTLEVKDDKTMGDTLHPDAIQKEEKENKEEGDSVKKTQVDQIEKKQAELLEKIEEQQQEQKKILAEQKEILKELKDHKNKQEEDAKKKDQELKGNNDANLHAVDSVPANLQGHADQAQLIQNQVEPVISHDLKSSLLKDNPESLPAFANLQPKNAYQVNLPVLNQPAELQSGQINAERQIPHGDQISVGASPQDLEMGKSAIQNDRQIVQGGIQPALANTGNQVNVMNIAGYAAGQGAYGGGQVDFGGNQEVPFGNQVLPASNKLPAQGAPGGNQAARQEYHGHSVNNINEVHSEKQQNEQVAEIKAGPPGLPSKHIQISGKKEPHIGNMAAEPIPNKKEDPILIDVGKNSVGDNAQKAASTHLEEPQNWQSNQDSPLNSNMMNEQQSKQRKPPLKVPVIKSYVQKETQTQGLAGHNFRVEKQESEKVLAASSQNKQKDKIIANKVKVAEENIREKKNKAHDEERRKRHVEAPYSLDFPELDLLKEVVRKDIGDVAYDTRHLLWTHRRRKKKRPNRNRDYQYWDET
ncbi:stress response protein NST1-like [Penaeus japonicus]|uniref:stress response protein NST1-like n=1 Tax=Penaeus japonicus TaxID=27405 RepID=UPI001C70B24C|nr:stress response protein NST1-like [Penaeus japonicus]